MPLVSVIIPSYNRKELLVRAIRSVLIQDLSDMELVVVDDGSTDATPSLAMEFSDPRLKWVHQSNAGVTAARNTGASVSTGDYLIFLDSDDELLQGYLKEFYELSQESPDLIFFGAEILAGSQNRTLIKATEPYGVPSTDGLFLAGTFAIRRSIFDRSGGYDEKLAYGENTELSFRLNPISLKRIFIDEPLLRINQMASRDSVAPHKIRASISHMLIKHREFFSRHPHILFLYLRNLGVACLRLRLSAEARAHFFTAWKMRPLFWKAAFRLALSCSPGKVYGRFYPPPSSTAR